MDTILDRWKASFPTDNEHPENNPEVINRGTSWQSGLGPKLVNSSRSPERDLPRISDSWSAKEPHPLKGVDGDIMALWNSMSDLTGAYKGKDSLLPERGTGFDNWSGRFMDGTYATPFSTNNLLKKVIGKDGDTGGTARSGSKDSSGKVQKITAVGTSRIYSYTDLNEFENFTYQAEVDPEGSVLRFRNFDSIASSI